MRIININFYKFYGHPFGRYANLKKSLAHQARRNDQQQARREKRAVPARLSVQICVADRTGDHKTYKNLYN